MIQDVATEAGVSVASVSRVLANSGTVTEKTRKKVLVLVAVEALKYKPNVMARNLRVSATRAILVVVPDITNPFFSEILRGIELVANQNGYQVLLGDSDNRLEREIEYLDFLRQRQADGMILLTARMDQKLIEDFASQYPVVLACEYFKAARKAGVKVPWDLEVIGMDNIKFSSIFEPTVTTIGQPMYEIGNKAMELLLKVINKEEKLQKKFVLEEGLIVRESCGAMRGETAGEAME